MFRKTPFLQGNDLIDQILKLTKIVGTKETVDYIKEFKLSERKGTKKEYICHDIIEAFQNGDIKVTPPTDFSEYIDAHTKENATPEAIDLIKRLLTIDYVIPS